MNAAQTDAGPQLDESGSPTNRPHLLSPAQAALRCNERRNRWVKEALDAIRWAIADQYVPGETLRVRFEAANVSDSDYPQLNRKLAPHWRAQESHVYLHEINVIAVTPSRANFPIPGTPAEPGALTAEQEQLRPRSWWQFWR